MGNQLNCLEQCRAHREQDQRLLMLQKGAVFKRKKTVLGLSAGSEAIRLSLSADENYLLWRLHENHNGAKPKRVEVNEISTIKTKGSLNFTIVAKDGGTLLDLEADNEEQRDTWASSLQVLCDDGAGEEQGQDERTSSFKLRKMLDERAKKQAYWTQRTEALQERQGEAEERKKRFSGVGMKYTAIAMANRATSSTE